MNNKSEKEEIKGYVSFMINTNEYTDDLYDDIINNTKLNLIIKFL